MKYTSRVLQFVLLVAVLLIGCSGPLAPRSSAPPPGSSAPVAPAPGPGSIRLLDMNETIDLSGKFVVWKDYVRSSKEAKIFWTDGNQSGTTQRGSFNWGWRVVWQMNSADDARKYAYDEAARVLAVHDANPLAPGLDPVNKISVNDVVY